jgi:hypothetical protein
MADRGTGWNGGKDGALARHGRGHRRVPDARRDCARRARSRQRLDTRWCQLRGGGSGLSVPHDRPRRMGTHGASCLPPEAGRQLAAGGVSGGHGLHVRHDWLARILCLRPRRRRSHPRVGDPRDRVDRLHGHLAAPARVHRRSITDADTVPHAVTDIHAGSVTHTGGDAITHTGSGGPVLPGASPRGQHRRDPVNPGAGDRPGSEWRRHGLAGRERSVDFVKRPARGRNQARSVRTRESIRVACCRSPADRPCGHGWRARAGPSERMTHPGVSPAGRPGSAGRDAPATPLLPGPCQPAGGT